MNPSLNAKGYPTVYPRVDGVSYTRTVHRLILEAWLGPRPTGMVCRHLDGVRTNTALNNLSWGTYSENRYDQILHGTSERLLNDEQAIEIVRLKNTGSTTRQIADRFEVSSSVIHGIVCGATYTQATGLTYVKRHIGRGRPRKSPEITF